VQAKKPWLNYHPCDSQVGIFQDDPSSKFTRTFIDTLLLYLSFGCEASIRGSKSTGEFFGQEWVKNTDFFTILIAKLVFDDLLSWLLDLISDTRLHPSKLPLSF